jgi:hypothetical protein
MIAKLIGENETVYLEGKQIEVVTVRIEKEQQLTDFMREPGEHRWIDPIQTGMLYLAVRVAGQERIYVCEGGHLWMLGEDGQTIDHQ